MRLLIVLCILCSTTLAARRTYYRVHHRPVWTVDIREDDQTACQRKADYMARHYISGHPLKRVGRFEGTGYGRSNNPGTCVPYYRMTLTGDATARASNGMTYRVRSWR